ncbi:putative Pollike protein, partial [Globisporangium splendens]
MERPAASVDSYDPVQADDTVTSDVGVYPRAQALVPAFPVSTADSAHVPTSGTEQGSGPVSVPAQPKNPARSPATCVPTTDDGMTIQLRAKTTLAANCNDTQATVNPNARQGTQTAVNPDARQGTQPPTLRSLLQRTKEIRRDHVEPPEKNRVELPKPLAADIEAIDALYEAGGDWSALAPRIDLARPYVLPRARYVMVIETGQAFQRTSPNKLLASFSNDHGNEVVQQQMDLNQLGQLTKMPGGNFRIKVKTKEACFRLERQEVTILGGKYRFREFDILADRFYIDVSSVDSDVDADLMLKRFYELGAQPIYDTFRDVNLEAVMTTATWRVYFRSNECPSQLFVDGSVCDQLVFAGRIHPVHAKDAPFPAQRMPFGHRSRYALVLQEPMTAASTRGATQQRQSPPQQVRTFADVVVQQPRATSLQLALRQDAIVQQDASSTRPPTNRAPSELSLSTSGSVMLSPPGSPKTTLKQLPPPPPPSSENTAGSKKKEKRTPTLDEKHGPRFQIVPRKAKAPPQLSESKEASHFLTKHHTSVVKTEKPTPIQEIVAEMETAEETADPQLLPDRLAVADSKVPGLRKVLRHTNNADVVVYCASCSTPLAFNTVLLQEMAATSPHVSELAHLHLINRVLSATDPDESTTFANKRAKHLGDKVPKKREELFQRVAPWWKVSSDSTKELARATRALALFELMLMCTAPRVFEKDYWLQHVTSMSIAWIPAHNRRLLHPNLLLVLLRSKLGAICFQLWKDIQWQGSLLDDLEALRTGDGFYPDDASVLQLQKVDDQLTLEAVDTVEISWQGVSLLTVNTNGIKKNGHLIENLLQRHSVSCVQETKLRDSHHLDALKFNHDARFQHKLFVNDPGANSSTQTTGRFRHRGELPDLTVPGHYLVIRVSVGDVPVYIHNVYSPVDDSDKRVFFDHLRVDMFEDNATRIVLGDLNTPLDPSIDSSQPSLRARPGRSACLGWLGQLGVVDPWCIHHPDERVYTGPQPRKNRLDYILMSEDLSNAVYGDAKYFEPKGAGDHLVHQVTLCSMSQLQGHGYWRFPAYLLEYPEVVEAIRGEAQQVLHDLQAASNPGKVWEQWKKSIRRQLQALQRKLRPQNEAAVEAARRTLDEAANRYHEDRLSVSQAGFHAALEAYRDCANRSSCCNQDAAFDFQAQHAETSSKYFFRPLDTSLRRVSIEEVQTSDGRVSRNSQDISAGFRTHWRSIMGDPDSPAGPTSPTDSSSRRKLLDTIDRRLSVEEQDLLNAPISGVDLADALKHMKASSAPGMDGLTAGFYQVATNVFGECLSIVFNCQLARGELLYSQRQSAVCLLHKKGSRSDPGNFRPISLMGVDVKALSKTLTYRLQLFLPKLIHADQKAFVKGRSIHHHIRFLADLQDLVTAQDEEAYAMFLDFEKAYDRVNWDYMFQVLDRMGCGGAFSDWVKLLYTSPQAHLLINGHIQPAICPTRGVKQGDPLSALLFLMVIEPLGNLLRQHEEHGICLTEDHTVPGLFFADDSTLLSGSVQGIQAQLDFVQEYCDGSGAKL